MRRKCVFCVAKGAPPSQFVMSVSCTIVMNVLTRNKSSTLPQCTARKAGLKGGWVGQKFKFRKILNERGKQCSLGQTQVYQKQTKHQDTGLTELFG